MERKMQILDKGFYLSDDEDFSHRWAKVREHQTTYLNSYELDLTNLKVKRLERDEEWFRYIFANRRGQKQKNTRHFLQKK